MSDTVNFVIDQGSDWNQQIVFQNDDGSLMNLTGCQIRMQARAFLGSPVVLLDLSTTAGTITLNGAAAQINWIVPSSQTINFQPAASNAIGSASNSQVVNFGYFDLLIKWPNGQITPYLSGQILLKLCVTQPF